MAYNFVIGSFLVRNLDMSKLICLMPTYNKEATLAKAIESVLMQKTDFDFKLIILDDCSTDNSYKIAQEYKEKFPTKIEIVRNKTNLKLLRTIMYGYKLLKGADYFCVLDADDWYISDKKFANAVEFLDSHLDYTIYMTNVLLKTSNGERPLKEDAPSEVSFNFKDRKDGKAFFIQTSGVVYRNIYFKNGQNKDFENILNYDFPESYRADGFRYEWYLYSGKAYFKNSIEAVYNYDENGIWSSMSECEQILHNAKIMYACAQFIKDEEKYYLHQAKKMFKIAILNMKNSNYTPSNETMELIAKLTMCLTFPINPVCSNILKTLIKFIPNKKLRQKLRKELI